MSIDNLTFGELKQIASLFGAEQAAEKPPYEVGKPYLIRTVTMILTGRVVYVGRQEIVLRDAAWIADTGRYATAVASAEFSEVEPYPDDHEVIVGRASVIDATQIKSLPRKQK
jgi:hypothetical protein